MRLWLAGKCRDGVQSRSAMKAPTSADSGSAVASAPTTAKKILLVDDHPITRQGLRMLIAQQPGMTVVGESDNAAQAMDLAAKLKPDIAVVDIALRSANGIELTKNLKAHSPDLLVLIVSMHDEELFAERALRAGARGYLMKHEASERVIEALEKIASGELYVSDRVRAHALAARQQSHR